MITIKQCLKAVGVTIVCFCASFLTFLFQSFRLDLLKMDTNSLTEIQKAYYDAQIAQSNVMLGVTGGLMLSFALVTMAFSICRYIDDNQANMGILKAMGYSRLRISVEFLKYGLNTFLGCLLGFLFSIIFNPMLYQEMNKDHILESINITFHPVLTFLVLFAPPILFALLGFLIAYFRLHKNPLVMIKGTTNVKARRGKDGKDFLSSLGKTVLRSHIAIIIFVGFAAMCFGATIQMSFSLKQLGTSPLFFWLMFSIGLLLGVSILYLAFGFVYQGNKKYMTLLKAYGYSNKECLKFLYGGYLLISVIVFIIGTIYEVILMKIMVRVFSNVQKITYNFSFKALLYTLLIIIPIYFVINYYYYYRMKHITISDVLKED